MVSIGVVGNCQADGIAAAIAAMTGVEAKSYRLSGVLDGTTAISRAHDVQIELKGVHTLPGGKESPFRYPALTFSGYHPDVVYLRDANGGSLAGPMGPHHSA